MLHFVEVFLAGGLVGFASGYAFRGWIHRRLLEAGRIALGLRSRL